MALDAAQVNLVDFDLFATTSKAVVDAQQCTKDRMESILNYVYRTSTIFDSDE
jgi:hypothetical protein